MTSKEALAIGTDTKPPVFFRGEYEQWKDRFLNFIERQDLGNFIIQSLEEGLMETQYREPTAGTQEVRVALSYTDLTANAKLRAKGDRLAKSYILQGITNEIYVKIDSYKASAKQMWDQLEKMMLGSKIGNQLKISNSLHSFEEFKGRTGETLEGTYDRFVTLLNELRKNKVNKSQIELNIKFLSILQPEWKSFSRQMRQIKDLNEIPLHEVMTSKEALAIGTDTKPPVFFRGEYEQWKDRFLNFIERQDLGNFIIQSLEEGLMETQYREPAAGAQEVRVALSYTDLTADAKLRAKGDRLAKSYILQGITNEIYVKIDSYKASAKQMWDQLEKMMLGSKIGNQLKISNCLHSFEEFKGRTGETLEGTYDRFVTLLNELSKNKVNKSQIELNIKFLSILQPEWKSFSRQMRQIKDLNEIPLHEVYVSVTDRHVN
ncbi:hypothetical protein L6452_36357 [Arctium lappa]|uniref:Uncharacterized protein n=1 Tax=Arctium lappa TaxID=4217 RepID=A0ACB8Y914_ARCLA|nr:hypothetical protein L6452_36357 [Arctium lappa]